MNEHTHEDERELARRFARGRSQPLAGCPNELTLAAWLDGRLSAAATAPFEEHLALCARCRQALSAARGLLSAPPGPPPPGLIARARALVSEAGPAAERRRGRGWHAVAAWAAAAAAALALGAAGWRAGSAVAQDRERGPDGLAAALPLQLTQSHQDGVFARLLAGDGEVRDE